MDLLKLISEEAAGGAVGAEAIAGHSMPLFSTLIKREPPSMTTKPTKMKFKNKKKTLLNLKETFQNTNDNSHDEIVSKLRSLERKNSTSYRNITTFGLQDEKDNIIKISVPNEQAESFERALSAYLADEMEGNESTPDVAEILWNLKNHFNIVNVEWPNVEEDEEEVQTVETPSGEEGEQNKEEKQQENDDISSLLGADEENASQTTSTEAKNLLQQVVDMMKADAEARKKEAEAREKEAQAEIEEIAMRQAVAKVKQEEMFLDMEEYNKAKRAKEQEAKRLAKLAKWKHDMAKEQGLEGLPDQEIDLGLPTDVEQEDIEDVVLKSEKETAEDEEFSKQTITKKYNKATSDEIADFIVRRIK